MWRCQFSLLVCPSSYYFIYIFFLISSIVLFNMCRRSAPVASSYLLMYSLHVELILMGYDGEDMIVLGTSGCGDDLVCNVGIFLGRVDFLLTSAPSPPRSPTPTILLYLDALTSPIRKRIRAMPVLLCYQHCSVRYIFNFALISSIS